MLFYKMMVYLFLSAIGLAITLSFLLRHPEGKAIFKAHRFEGAMAIFFSVVFPIAPIGILGIPFVLRRVRLR